MEAAALRGVPLAAPSIVIPEVVGAIRRRAGETLADEARGWLASADFITTVDVTYDLAARAAEIAIAGALKGCDAIYVALAQELGDTLVSFDHEQLERGAAFVTVFRPP